MIETKVCTKCEIEQWLNNFYKSVRSKDGYHHICKECMAKSK